jgi:hypothetical protein
VIRVNILDKILLGLTIGRIMEFVIGFIVEIRYVLVYYRSTNSLGLYDGR